MKKTNEMGRRKGLGPERSVLAVGHTLVHTSTRARTGARTGVPPNQLPGFMRFPPSPPFHSQGPGPAGLLSPLARLQQ